MKDEWKTRKIFFIHPSSFTSGWRGQQRECYPAGCGKLLGITLPSGRSRCRRPAAVLLLLGHQERATVRSPSIDSRRTRARRQGEQHEGSVEWLGRRFDVR